MSLVSVSFVSPFRKLWAFLLWGLRARAGGRFFVAVAMTGYQSTE